ncbi:MAG: ABC transporter permease subunit [Proteobacteria bacterium]|nr:ABC transporter permease subunit [Pseudomonadota bacterium]
MSRWMERTLIVFCWICGLALLAAITAIIGYLLYKGMGTVNLTLIFGDTSPVDALLLRKHVFAGLFPAMVGTVAVVTLSVGFAIPVGIASGIYMAEYARGGVKTVLGFFFDILAGVPSIVIGLFGFALAIFLHKHFSSIYPSLFISSLSLAVLVLPYIIRSTQFALENLPAATKLIAVALGATKLQNIVYVLIPKSLSGIFSGVILATGRCAEDTAVILLTGAVAFAGVPKSLFAQYEALPFYIYYISSQYANQQELLSGYGASIILLLICALLFFIASMIRKGVTYQALYRA